jgi:hypothetical protein
MELERRRVFVVPAQTARTTGLLYDECARSRTASDHCLGPAAPAPVLPEAVDAMRDDAVMPAWAEDHFRSGRLAGPGRGDLR